MTRSLKDIHLHEVSLVGQAANKKNFLFFKQEEDTKDKPAKKLKKKINITIDSDGTIGGTKISVNKKVLKNLRDFSFSFWESNDPSRAVSASYSKMTENDDGFNRSETFYLSKGDSKMKDAIKDKVKKYLGKDSDVDLAKTEEEEVMLKCLDTVLDYQDDFPDDLKKAVGIIAKQAGLADADDDDNDDDTDDNDTNDDDKGDDDADVKKSGAKLSKDTMKKLQSALATLKSILPQLAEKSAKNTNDDDSSDEVLKAIKELTKSLGSKKKKTKDGKDDSDITKALKELTSRISKVEKTTSGKHNIEGQDDDDDEISKDGETLWPSFNVDNDDD